MVVSGFLFIFATVLIIYEKEYGRDRDSRKEIAVGVQEFDWIQDCAVRFAADTRPVYAIGLNISQDRRTIESYEITKVK